MFGCYQRTGRAIYTDLYGILISRLAVGDLRLSDYLSKWEGSVAVKLLNLHYGRMRGAPKPLFCQTPRVKKHHLCWIRTHASRFRTTGFSVEPNDYS